MDSAIVAWSLGLIILRGQSLGHVVRLRHRNELTERGWENAGKGLERYPTFAQLGPDCQKRKQMQRTNKSQHAYFQG